jgi:hypothetical protein
VDTKGGTLSEANPFRQEIRQPWLTSLRILWVVLVLYNLLPGLLGIPSYFIQLVNLDPWPNTGGWTQENFRAVVSNAGIIPEVIAWVIIVPAMIKMVVFFSIGLVIFFRRSNEWIGLLASFVLVSLCGTFMGDRLQFIDGLPHILQVIAYEASISIWLAFFIFLILFPDGRFTPRWTRWVALGLTIWFILTEIFNQITGRTPVWLFNFGFTILFCILLGMYYRYMRVSNQIERKQIHWFLFSIIIFFVVALLQSFFENFSFLPPQPEVTELIKYIAGIYISSVVILLIPISIGISIFRYHLWDIDIVIRRTLVYSTLTVLLVLVYFGSVTLMQAVFSGLSGQTSPLALVISTLLIAVLINPLRKRVQSTIDRRFFRHRYDAEQALTHFGLALRNEVGLEPLAQHILQTGQETMRPEHISLWMRSRK